MNDMNWSPLLKLVGHRPGVGARRISVDPVRFGFGIKLETQGVLPEQTHDQAGRGYGKEKDDR